MNYKKVQAQVSDDPFAVPPPPGESGASGSFDVPAPPQTTQNVPATRAPSASGNTVFPAVKTMQQAITNFSNTLANNYLMSMDTKTTGRQTRSREDGTGDDTLGGSNPFGRFLVNQYVNNADVVGKQFVNVDEAEPVRSGAGAAHNIDLRGVINTIGRIGTPGHERNPDGIWKSRTNNALKQIAAVAAALMKLQEEMRIPVEGYSQDDLKELQQTILPNYTDYGNEMGTAAAKLTTNINKLNAFYKNFEKAILNNDKYKSLITQDQPLVKYQGATQLNKEEQDFFSTNNQKVIPGVTINGHPVKLADIGTMKNFQDFLAALRLKNDPETFNKILGQIETALTSGATASNEAPVNPRDAGY